MRGIGYLVLGSVLLLSGCANSSGARAGLFGASAPVIAVLADDLFTGTAETDLSGSGRIEIQSTVNPDVRCIGSFAYVGTGGGTAVVRCNDGAEARLSFQSKTSLSGYGFGPSTRGPASFTYGMTTSEAQEYLKLPSRKKLVERDKKPAFVDI